MLKFGFIGFGQVGGNFVDLTKLKNYPSMAINTAKVDLNVLKNLDKNERVHLLGYEGAGKDRSIGSEALMEHVDTIKERIQEKMDQCHVIFPVFALGGGTGSGSVGPAVSMLTEMFEDKVISPIVFMPHKNESTRAKMNALEAFSELSMIEETGATFVIDNTKVMEMDKYKGVNLKEKYQKVHQQIISLLDTFNRKTQEESVVSNLDKMDLLMTLSERGSAIISGFTVGEEHVKDSECFENVMVKSWEDSVLADLDLTNISKASFVLNIPEDMTKHLELDSAFRTVGKPLEVFTGIFDDNDAKVYSLVTGLSYPNDLLKEFEDEIQNEEKRIHETLDKARNQNFAVKSSWTNSLKRKRKVRV